jgi:hypothetical protein
MPLTKPNFSLIPVSGYGSDFAPVNSTAPLMADFNHLSEAEGLENWQHTEAVKFQEFAISYNINITGSMPFREMYIT